MFYFHQPKFKGSAAVQRYFEIHGFFLCSFFRLEFNYLCLKIDFSVFPMTLTRFSTRVEDKRSLKSRHCDLSSTFFDFSSITYDLRSIVVCVRVLLTAKYRNAVIYKKCGRRCTRRYASRDPFSIKLSSTNVQFMFNYRKGAMEQSQGCPKRTLHCNSASFQRPSQMPVCQCVREITFLCQFARADLQSATKMVTGASTFRN